MSLCVCRGVLPRIEDPRGKLLAGRAQFPPMIRVRGAVPADQRPECGGVVGLPGVAELVHQDVVHEDRREKQEPGVQGNDAEAGTAPPAAASDANRTPGVREAAAATHIRQTRQ